MEESLEDKLNRKILILELLGNIQVENPDLAKLRLGELISLIVDRAYEIPEIKEMMLDNEIIEKFGLYLLSDESFYKAIKLFARDKMVEGIIK